MPVVEPGGGGSGGGKAVQLEQNDKQEWIIRVKKGEILRIVYEE